MFEIEVIPHENYLELVCCGPGNLENLKGVVDKIANGSFPGVGQNKIGENVAVNRGAKIFSTDDETEARDWLLADI